MKKGNRPKRRDHRFRIPLDIDTASEGVHGHRFLGLERPPFCVTLGESSGVVTIAAHRRRD